MTLFEDLFRSLKSRKDYWDAGWREGYGEIQGRLFFIILHFQFLRLRLFFSHTAVSIINHKTYNMDHGTRKKDCLRIEEKISLIFFSTLGQSSQNIKGVCMVHTNGCSL